MMLSELEIKEGLKTDSGSFGDFSLFRGFIKIARLKLLTEEINSLPKERVKCGIPNVSYSEQSLPKWTEIYGVFSSRLLDELARNILGKKEMISMSCWTSIYGYNEYINPHKDISGDIQLILCLKNEGKGSTGLICLETKGCTYSIFLEPGDMLIFKANEITHYTTPIPNLGDNSGSARIVAVARKHFS